MGLYLAIFIIEKVEKSLDKRNFKREVRIEE